MKYIHNLKFEKLILLSFIYLEFYAFVTSIKNIYNFFVIYLLILILAYNFFKNINKLNFLEKQFRSFYLLTLLYFFFQLIRGCLIAESYWEYKWVFYNYLPWFFCLTGIFFGYLVNEVNKGLFKIFYFVITFSLITLFYFENNQIFQKSFAWIYIPILFYNYLSKNQKIVLLLLTVFIISMFYFDWRTQIIRIVYSYLIIFIISFNILKSKVVIKIICNFFIISPFIYLFLITNINYDLFDLILSKESTLPLENTRSFLIEQIIEEMKISEISFLFGGSPTQSFYSYHFLTDDNFVTGQFNRFSAETGFVTLFLKTGLIGLILLSILNLYSISNLLKNNNKISLILSLSIAFNWILFFIELPIVMNFSNFLFFLLPGLAFSKIIKDLK